MAVLIKTERRILQEILEALAAGDLLTNQEVARSGFVMAQTMSTQIRDLFRALDVNTSQAFISEAQGGFLDLIADLFQITRLAEQAATAAAADRNVRFFVNSGTLAAELPSKTIPIGTEIRNSDGSTTYRVVTEARFNDVDTEVYVTVVSSQTGESQRVGAGELVVHDLGGTVQVRNEAAISNATNVEGDELLRSRIADAMLTRVSGNLASIREATLIAPGVSEARFTPFANGPGTVEVTAIPVGNGPDESMLGQVRANIDIVRSAGTRVDVRGPRFVPVEIVVLLVFGPNVGEGLKPDIRLAAQDAILGYISSLRLGQQFIVNEMIQRIMDTDDRILDTEIRCFAFRRRAQVLRNFQPESDEVLIPDPKSEQPITVL